jgi:SAM-dependent methyltransferase
MDPNPPKGISMSNIIDFIDKNPETITDWVTEFFAGKYSRTEVADYLYKIDAEGMPRRGVVQLASEFNSLEEIKEWYTNTDFYVFDLLPWNGCNMFKEKAEQIVKLIKQKKYTSILDFGGGLGVLSMYIKEMIPECTVHYVDLKDGVTFQFAQFLMEKYKLHNDIHVMDDEEFFESGVFVDCILATDCFEHIPNMEEVFGKLTMHSYNIYHDSTFFSDKWSPQHVYTPVGLEFINMAALYNYLPNNTPTLLTRAYLRFDDSGQIQIHLINT